MSVTAAPPEHVDVLILGAGLSGIGAAAHLTRAAPRKSFAILEAREAIGGTWDLFRYPGIRSDSDMYTLGYDFKPWTNEKSIADGADIREYIRETAREHGIDEHIRFGHKVVRADFDSSQARWTVTAQRADTGEEVQHTCSFLFANTGYYDYDQGYTPDFAGQDDFAGQVVHPQFWPEDLDVTGKRIVVIGSGATAVTLIPALVSAGAGEVTMLQRTPTYIVALPSVDKLAKWAYDHFPSKTAYAVARWENVLLTMGSYQLSRRRPKAMKAILRKRLERMLPADYDIDTHFNPPYDPWDQRLCVVPSGDLFKAIQKGKATIVTDHIERFTERGIALKSGNELEADIVVTATGLRMKVVGGIRTSVDGKQIQPHDTVAYKGMMLAGVPNFALTIGYTNASWTLKADLVADYVVRLLQEMDRRGAAIVEPVYDDDRPADQPFMDLKSGYVTRALDQLPKQGHKAPWKLHQNYILDLAILKRQKIDDGVLRFRGRRQAPAAGTERELATA